MELFALLFAKITFAFHGVISENNKYKKSKQNARTILYYSIYIHPYITTSYVCMYGCVYGFTKAYKFTHMQTDINGETNKIKEMRIFRKYTKINFVLVSVLPCCLFYSLWYDYASEISSSCNRYVNEEFSTIYLSHCVCRWCKVYYAHDAVGSIPFQTTVHFLLTTVYRNVTTLWGN